MLGGSGMLGMGMIMTLHDGFSANADRIGNSMSRLEGIAEATAVRVQMSMNKVKMGLAGVAISAAMLAPMIMGLNTTARLSDKMADVQKTTGMVTEEVRGLKSELFKLDTRSSIDDLLEISAVGGQVGVAKEQIMGFTESVDKLNVALGDEFTGGAEEVASVVGTLRNVFSDIRTDQIDVDLLHIGNAINELGAAGFATGPVVADLANRIGGIGIPLGMASGQVLGLSATLQELNVSAERGGTAVGRILSTMGGNISEFAKIAGMDTGAFTDLFNKDITAAFTEVLKGSKRMGTNSTELLGIMDKLGLNGIGVMEVFMKLGDQTDMLQEKIGLATGALEGNSSIMAEFNTKNETAGAILEKVRNKFTQLSDALGEAIAPILLPIVEVIGKIAQGFALLANNPVGQVLLGILGTVALLIGAISILVVVQNLATMAAGKAALAFIGMGMAEVGTAFATGGLTAGMYALAVAVWTALAPILPFIAAAAALIGIAILLKKSWAAFGDVMEGNTKPATGFMGIMQKIGGVLQGVWQIFKSFDGSTFTMGEDMLAALDKLGIKEAVLNLGTWFTRIKMVWIGMRDAFSSGWKIMKKVFGAIGDVVNPIMDKLGMNFSKASGSMETFKRIGMAIAGVIALMLSPIIILVGVIYLAYNAIKLLIAGSIWLGSAIASAFSYIAAVAVGAFDWLVSLPERAWEFGANMITSIKEGLLSKLGDIRSWAADAFSWMGDLNPFAEDSEIDINKTVDLNAPQRPIGDMTARRDLALAGVNKPMVFDKTSTKTESIQLDVILDSERIGKKVLDRQNLEDSRE